MPSETNNEERRPRRIGKFILFFILVLIALFLGLMIYNRMCIKDCVKLSLGGLPELSPAPKLSFE